MERLEPLRRHLHGHGTEHVTLSFSEIDGMLSAPLPEAAEYPSWWTNDPGRPESEAWLAAGYEVAFISTDSRSVTFIKSIARAS